MHNSKHMLSPPHAHGVPQLRNRLLKTDVPYHSPACTPVLQALVQPRYPKNISQLIWLSDEWLRHSGLFHVHEIKEK